MASIREHNDDPSTRGSAFEGRGWPAEGYPAGQRASDA
jgi:hypothetical protein